MIAADGKDCRATNTIRVRPGSGTRQNARYPSSADVDALGLHTVLIQLRCSSGAVLHAFELVHVQLVLAEERRVVGLGERGDALDLQERTARPRPGAPPAVLMPRTSRKQSPTRLMSTRATNSS